MYDSAEIDIFIFGAIDFVIETIFCFCVITDLGDVYFFEIK